MSDRDYRAHAPRWWQWPLLVVEALAVTALERVRRAWIAPRKWGAD